MKNTNWDNYIWSETQLEMSKLHLIYFRLYINLKKLEKKKNLKNYVSKFEFENRSFKILYIYIYIF